MDENVEIDYCTQKGINQSFTKEVSCMLKKFKQLFEINGKIDTLKDEINQLNQQVQNLSNKKPPTRYRELPLTKDIMDYEQLKTLFEERYRKDALSKYFGIKDNLQECIIQYDKVLYSNKASINYVEVISKLYELDTLRSFILQLLFGTTDIPSFYFYAVNNRAFYETVTSLPYIDTDRIFLLEYEQEPIDVSYYTIVNMYKDKIIIVSPNGDFEMENRYRKTVVRVLFSIYFDKYFLYHLADTSSEAAV